MSGSYKKRIVDTDAVTVYARGMLNKTLQGATVKEVYWSVTHPAWLAVGGEKFTSPVDARRYAEDAVSVNSPKALIETRIVFEYPNKEPVPGHPMPGRLDTAVERVIVDYTELIRRFPED